MKRSMIKGEKRVRFEMKAESGSNVFVAGTFNNWDPTQYRMVDNPHGGIFAADVLLPKGRHEYKFIVNGKWCEDPACTETTPNDCGSLNSVIQVS